MFNKRNNFTLIELIVVIAVLGILSSIIIPNIANLNQKAQVSAISSNIKNVQTAVDAYKMEHGIFPTTKHPLPENPELINFNLLYPIYLKDYPDILGEDYWVDFLGTIWASTSNTVEIKGRGTSEISWEGIPNVTEYQVYELINKGNESNLRAVANFNLKDTQKNLKKSRKDLFSLETKESSTLIKFSANPKKSYLVGARDSLGFLTAPVGFDYYSGGNITIPDNQISRELYINTFAIDTADWLSISKTETIPDGASITYEFAYSDDNGATWSDWHPTIDEVPNSKALKIKVALTRTEGKKSPILHNLKVNYASINSPDGVGECNLNLLKPNNTCSQVKPPFEEDFFKPDVPNITLPNGGSGSHQFPNTDGGIITDIVPDYEVSSPNNSSNSKPDIDYNVSYDGGHTWQGPFLNIIDVPNKDSVTNIEVDYKFPPNVSVVVKPPFVNTTNPSNKDEVDNSVEKPKPVYPEYEDNWITLETFTLEENHNEMVQWGEVIVNQDKENNDLGRLSVFLSTSNDGVNWSKEIQGVENMSQVSNSEQLKVRLLSEYHQSATELDAPLFESITVKANKMNGDKVENIYSTNEFGQVVNATPNISIKNNLSNLTTESLINWIYIDENDNFEIVEEKWVLDGVESSQPPNGKLIAGTHTISLKVKNSKGIWSELISKSFKVSPVAIKKTASKQYLDQYSNKSKYVDLKQVSSKNPIQIRLGSNRSDNIIYGDQGAKLRIYENGSLVQTTTIKGNKTYYSNPLYYTPKQDNVSIRLHFESLSSGSQTFTDVVYYGY